MVGVAAASQGPGAPLVLWENTNAPEHLWTLCEREYAAAGVDPGILPVGSLDQGSHRQNAR